jgi:hypothetical protein
MGLASKGISTKHSQSTKHTTQAKLGNRWILMTFLACDLLLVVSNSFQTQCERKNRKIYPFQAKSLRIMLNNA